MRPADRPVTVSFTDREHKLVTERARSLQRTVPELIRAVTVWAVRLDVLELRAIAADLDPPRHQRD